MELRSTWEVRVITVIRLSCFNQSNRLFIWIAWNWHVFTCKWVLLCPGHCVVYWHSCNYEKTWTKPCKVLCTFVHGSSDFHVLLYLPGFFCRSGRPFQAVRWHPLPGPCCLPRHSNCVSLSCWWHGANCESLCPARVMSCQLKFWVPSIVSWLDVLVRSLYTLCISEFESAKTFLLAPWCSGSLINISTCRCCQALHPWVPQPSAWGWAHSWSAPCVYSGFVLHGLFLSPTIMFCFCPSAMFLFF